MKYWTLPLAALMLTIPLAAQARGNAQQRAAMLEQMSHVQTLIAGINQSYGTHFAVMPKAEAMAMANMAMANMEMTRAAMETQLLWSANPPTSAGGQ